MAETDLVRILDGDTFVLSEKDGNINQLSKFPMGLFALDTRFLSEWELRVNGGPVTALSVDNLNYHEAQFFLIPGEPTQYVDSDISIIRHRTLGGSFDERLTFVSHRLYPIKLTVRLNVGCDFADVFDVKDEKKQRRGDVQTHIDGDRLRFSYRREGFWRETAVSSEQPAWIDQSGLTWEVTLEPRAEWTTRLHVEAIVQPGQEEDFGTSLQTHTSLIGRRMAADLRDWVSHAPRLESGSDALADAYQTSLADLFALRFSPPGWLDQIPAAGLPWFMTVFGRDSIFTSLQTLPFLPDLARATLRILIAAHGSRLDTFREEEPGKVMHEIRYGESAAFEEHPASPYYGTADATPLYVVLLDEYERWTGDADMVRLFEVETRLCLDWIDTYGNLLDDGYVWYLRRCKENGGLDNQCWKDSWDSISYRDGRIPHPLRATCELQGYAYDAKLRGARMARKFWNDPAYADRLEREAAELKVRFNRDFWVEDGEYYALALAPENGRITQVDSLSSNIGHLLWSGIVDEDKAGKVVEHLMGPRLYSGWGVRTLAEGEGRYNPVGYHVGTVWPFDNSIIAWGLRRYGFDTEAARIAGNIIEAAPFFHGRLPEAFAGYDRAITRYPVEYPTACSPQAWSAGAPLLFLRTMLGLEPFGNHLGVRPVLPPGFGRIELHDIHGPWGRLDALGR